MADSFRIVSGDGKPPEISKKLPDTTIIQKIHKMDPATAYVAVQGVIIPTLNQLRKNFFYLSGNSLHLESPIHLSAPKFEKSSFIETSKSIDKIKSDLKDIQIRMKELEKNAKKILDLRIDSKNNDTKITRGDLWTYPDDNKFWNDPESHSGIFGRFFALKGVLEKRLASLQKELIILQKNMPNSSLVKTLEETIKYLLENIPKTSSKWNKKDWTYGGLTWKFKWDSVNIWWVAWDERTKNKGSPNPTGFLDLVQNKKKFAKYIEGIDKSFQDIDKFTSTKEFHLLKLKLLDTQSAYVYLTTVFIPFLQNEAAISLDKQGKRMELISKVFDRWNEIQNEVTQVARNSKEIHQWIKEGKVDSNYNLYKDKNYKEKETDNDKLEKWSAFKSFLFNLKNKQTQVRQLLDDMKKKFPDSMKSLIETMKKLTSKILEIPITREAQDLSSFLKVLEKSNQELRLISEIETLEKENDPLERRKKKLQEWMAHLKRKLGDYFHWDDEVLNFFWPSFYKEKKSWNEYRLEIEQIDKNMNANIEQIKNKKKELLQKEKERVAQPDIRLTLLSWMINSDQTQFKNYMDILGQGVTALTSISNMTQQMLQIDTQYYNSLLALQKVGQDTLNKTIQSIMNNMR